MDTSIAPIFSEFAPLSSATFHHREPGILDGLAPLDLFSVRLGVLVADVSLVLFRQWLLGLRCDAVRPLPLAEECIVLDQG